MPNRILAISKSSSRAAGSLFFSVLNFIKCFNAAEFHLSIAAALPKAEGGVKIKVCAPLGMGVVFASNGN